MPTEGGDAQEHHAHKQQQNAENQLGQILCQLRLTDRQLGADEEGSLPGADALVGGKDPDKDLLSCILTAQRDQGPVAAHSLYRQVSGGFQAVDQLPANVDLGILVHRVESEAGIPLRRWDAEGILPGHANGGRFVLHFPHHRILHRFKALGAPAAPHHRVRTDPQIPQQRQQHCPGKQRQHHRQPVGKALSGGFSACFALHGTPPSANFLRIAYLPDERSA